MTVSLKLESRLDTAASVRLQAQLQVQAGQDVRLDASQVELVGARSLEVLLAAREQARRSGRAFQIKPISDAAISDLRMLGLSIDDISFGGIS